MNSEDLLPIGTIIKKEESDALLMIVGYTSRMNIEKLMQYDYVCCIYPIGYMGSANLVLVNHDKIEKIEHMGYNSKKLKKVNELAGVINNLIQEGNYESN